MSLWIQLHDGEPGENALYNAIETERQRWSPVNPDVPDPFWHKIPGGRRGRRVTHVSVWDQKVGGWALFWVPLERKVDVETGGSFILAELEVTFSGWR